MTKAFVRQLRGLVSQATFSNVVTSVLDVWDAMAQEQDFVAADDKDVQRYLDIRARTVGLRPFFDILQFEFRLSFDQSQGHSALWQLEDGVTLAVALQNDIVGLSKDIAKGQVLNLALIHANQADDDLETGYQLAVEMHNRSVEAAASAASLASRGDFCDSELAVHQYVDCLLGFIDRHFAWAASSQRYASHIDRE